MKLKLLCGALALCSVTMLSGCGDNNSQGITLRLAQASAANGAIGISMDKFAQEVHEKSNGRITVLTFHNGQLGSERENIESVQMGDLDMAVVNQSVLINFVPELAAFDLPYTITSAQHADRVFLGDIGKEYLKQLEAVRLRGFSIWESGFRNLTNSVRDVNSVDDVAGLRIRVMENKIHQELWMALGADPVPMSWSDAYTGMQQGAIDGQENPATVIDKNNVVEVNKHMAVSEHCYSTVYILFSPKIWDRLSKEDQALLDECMRKAEVDERTLSRQMDKEAIVTLESKGMVVTYPDKQGFIEKSAPVREKYGAAFKTLLDRVAALAD
jgi:tripartite ATP-independent transporter DctP family solute receptor